MASDTQIRASETQILASETQILVSETQELGSETQILASVTQLLACSSLNLTYKLLKKGKSTVVYVLYSIIAPCYSMRI